MITKNICIDIPIHIINGEKYYKKSDMDKAIDTLMKNAMDGIVMTFSSKTLEK